MATAQDTMAGAAGREAESGAARLLATLRKGLFALMAIACLGTGAELALLGHYEDVWQWVPLVLLGLGAIAAILVLARPTRGTLRTFQGVMLLFVAAGGLGLYLHYKGNMEFELEMVPELAGLELIKKTLTGATPALAPGTMAQLGLFGLAATFRHSLLRSRTAQGNHEEGK